MPATTSSIAVSALTCCMSLSLASCRSSSSWHLAATKKGDTVELCLSNSDACPQPGGVSLTSISVYRWDNLHDNELVWDAQEDDQTTGGATISGTVTYGVPPKGWTNMLSPPALVCGKAYLVNPGAHYFALKCDGNLVLFDDPHLGEFFDGKVPAKKTK